MVSQRCIMAVKKELEKLGLCHSFVELGMFKTNEGLTTAQHDLLKTKLSKYGLELIENKKIILVEKIKKVIKKRGIELAENFGNLGVLGERSDPLLDRTITYILTGAKSSFDLKIQPFQDEIFNSKFKNLFHA